VRRNEQKEKKIANEKFRKDIPESAETETPPNQFNPSPLPYPAAAYFIGAPCTICCSC
jgi:hypothetical protein